MGQQKRTMRLVFSLLMLHSGLSAQIPAGYYEPAEGLTGSELKAALHDIISDHIKYPYTSTSTDVWDILKETDQDPNNPENVILLYTGRSQAKTENSGESSASGSNRWNREHVWSKSHGFPDEIDTAYTDIHHLRPADESVNSSRSNLDFDNGGNQHVEATECYYDSDSWEPRDAVKGDVARMMFYMVVRYDPGYHTDNSLYDLELVDSTGVDIGLPPGAPLFGKLSTLIQWHAQDPVDDFELNRQEVIYGYQGNRNPFIDNPQWVESIFSPQLSSNTRLDFIGNSLAVEENSGTIALEVSIINADSDVATTCEIQLTGGTGDLTDLIDFETTSLTFPPGSTLPQTVEVTIHDDDLVEQEETLIFSLTNVAGGDSASAGGNDRFVLSILPNDQVSAEPGLIISEVMDGNRSGGQPKFIEISNVSDEPIEIGGYQVWRGSNGGAPTSVVQFPGGSVLEPHGSWVIANSASGMVAAGFDDANQVSSAINGNGNDVYQLHTATGDYIDAFGLSGVSNPWYENSYAERMPHILSGGPSYAVEEWIITTLGPDSPANGSPGTPGTHISDPWVGVEPRLYPESAELINVYPNPFNVSTIISFQLPENSYAAVTIYDLQGRPVERLMADDLQRGHHTLKWQGINSAGVDLSSGIYFVQLATPGSVQIRQITLLK